MCVEEVGVDEALGDSLLFVQGLLDMKSIDVGKSRLDGLLLSLVCPNDRVVYIPGACVLSASVTFVERVVARAISSAASAGAE
jgi:hypothetical protein